MAPNTPANLGAIKIGFGWFGGGPGKLRGWFWVDLERRAESDLTVDYGWFRTGPGLVWDGLREGEKTRGLLFPNLQMQISNCAF